MIRSWSRYLVASVTAISAVLFVGNKAFSNDARPASRATGAESAGATTAAVKIYLRIDGIDGESYDPGRERWIEITSFSWGVVSGTSTTQPLQGLTLAANTSKASAKLAEAAVRSIRFPSATLSVVRMSTDRPEEYLTYVLTDVGVSSFQSAGASGGDTTDAFTLSPRALEVAYREQNRDGSLSTPVTVKVLAVK